MEKRISILLILLLVLITGLIILAVFDLIDWSGKITLGHVLEILTLIILVLITAMYALSASRQADASTRMAEEMKEQRRPIVVPKVCSAIGVPLQASVEDIEKHVYSDYFEIHNEGYGPAIELEILMLNQEKSLLQNQRETFFSRVSESPLEFHANGLTNQVNSTCYLLCRYRGVISSHAERMWYETWLPFEPIKSQRGDTIIIRPGELEFRQVPEKESY